MTYYWILCNVYTICHKSVSKKLNDLWDNYKKLKKYTISKKGATYLQRLHDFKDVLSNLFDIKCTNKERLSNQTYLWGVMMEKDDFAFYENQKKNPPIGICSTVVDKHSLAKTERAKEKRGRA